MIWDKTCGAKSASWNATNIAGYGLQHRVRAQTLRRADVGFVGGRKVQYQMGENWRFFSYITYGESEWGWSSSWYWDTKKQLNWWDTPIDCGVPYLPDFQTRTYEKLEKKRGHCNGTHAPLIRQCLEMSNRCVWVCESAVCVNHLCVCVCPPPKKGIPQMHWFRRWSRKCKAWCWRQCWRVVNLFQGCSVFPLCPDFIHVYIYIYYCTLLYIYNTMYIYIYI